MAGDDLAKVRADISRELARRRRRRQREQEIEDEHYREDRRLLTLDAFYETSTAPSTGWIGGINVDPDSRAALKAAEVEVREAGYSGAGERALALKRLLSGVPATELVGFALTERDRRRWNAAHRARLADRAERLGPRASQLASWLRPPNEQETR